MLTRLCRWTFVAVAVAVHVNVHDDDHALAS
jgi:hypothetical protein